MFKAIGRSEAATFCVCVYFSQVGTLQNSSQGPEGYDFLFIIFTYHYLIFFKIHCLHIFFYPALPTDERAGSLASQAVTFDRANQGLKNTRKAAGLLSYRPRRLVHRKSFPRRTSCLPEFLRSLGIKSSLE